MSGKKIFIGMSDTAGYGTRLSKAFNSIKIKSNLFVQKEHPFKYNSPFTIYVRYPKNKWLRRIYTRFFFFKCLFGYDAFIFFSGDSLLKNYKDFKYYKFFKKKTMMIFLGCDVQQPELTFKPEIPYSACHNCEEEFKAFVRCVPNQKIINTKKIEKIADIIVSHKAFSDALSVKYINIIQPINLEEFSKEIPKTGNAKPVILHAPSNFGYKGTKYLLEAIDKLKPDFEIELKLIQNISIDKLMEEILKSDIVVDQLIQGWYGMLPLEAMMLKKPVICYIRDDIRQGLPVECPIINANPETIYSVLKEIIQRKNDWNSIGEAGRMYVEKYHDSKQIAHRYSELLLN